MFRVVPSRKILVVGAVLFAAFVFLLWNPTLLSRRSARLDQSCLPVQQHNEHLSTPIKRHSVVVASAFGFHTDVYMALVWTLERITQKPVPVYHVDNEPFNFGFGEAVKRLGLHHGPVLNISDLPSALNNTSSDGTMIDLLVFGTCEVEYVRL
jgi:hypothetical protein